MVQIKIICIGFYVNLQASSNSNINLFFLMTVQVAMWYGPMHTLLNRAQQLRTCLSWGDPDKYHRLGGLNHRHFFLSTLEAGKSQIKVAADSVPGEGPPSGLPMATFSLWTHTAERSPSPCLPLLIRSLFHCGAPPPWPHLNLITFQWPHLQLPSHWGL